MRREIIQAHSEASEKDRLINHSSKRAEKMIEQDAYNWWALSNHYLSVMTWSNMTQFQLIQKFMTIFMILSYLKRGLTFKNLYFSHLRFQLTFELEKHNCTSLCVAIDRIPSMDFCILSANSNHLVHTKAKRFHCSPS